jgi:hypothetical protein
MNIYNGTATTNLTRNGFGTITGFSGGDLSTDWSYGGNVLTNNTGAGIYVVSYSAGYTASSNNFDSYFGISVNDGDPAKSIFRKRMTQSDGGNGACFAILNLSNGDDIRIKAGSDANNKSIVIKYSSLTAVKISGGTGTTESPAQASMDDLSGTTQLTLTAATPDTLDGFSNDITDGTFWSFSKNGLSPLGLGGGTYLLKYYVSFSSSVTAELLFRLTRNNTELQNLTSFEYINNGDESGIAFASGIVEITTWTDTIRLNVESNASSTFSVNQVRVELTRIVASTDPVPVELSAFNADILNNSVLLQWRTETEIDNYGFEVQRAYNVSGSEWETISFIQGKGTVYSPQSYSYNDTEVKTNGKVNYRLKQIDNSGTFEFSDIVTIEMAINNFEIYQNFPNPFNPSTKISYYLPFEAAVTISIFNIQGEKIAEYSESSLSGGTHSFDFNSNQLNFSLSSGTYFYRITAQNNQTAETYTAVRKMLFLK